MRDIRLSVVVPAFNEAARLPATLPRFAAFASEGGHQLIVVDDGSTDGTAEVAGKYLNGVDGASLVRLPKNRGKGAAVRAGVARARGDVVAYADADLASDLDDLGDLTRSLLDADIAVGSRAVAGAEVYASSNVQRYMGGAFNTLVRTVTAIPLRDTQCGLKAFRSPAAGLLFHLSRIDGWAFDVELLLLAQRLGYRVSEVPVHWHAVEGSHIRPVRDSVAMSTDVLRARRRWTPRRVLAAVRLYEDDPSTTKEAVNQLRRNLRRSDVVIPIGSGALSLLPYLDTQRASRVADRLRRCGPDLRMELTQLPGNMLLHPSAGHLRRGLAS